MIPATVSAGSMPGLMRLVQSAPGESYVLPSEAGEPLTRALDFIEQHFVEPVSLAQLAELSALSVSRFATVFRQRVGVSPYKYLCLLRVRRAQTLLLEGIPGSVVAVEVGFFDQSHLARHFKRLCGMTPSVFLRRAQTGGV